MIFDNWREYPQIKILIKSNKFEAISDFGILAPILIVLVLFVISILVFSKENLDYVAYALIAAVFSCIVTAIYFNLDSTTLMGNIEYKSMIYALIL